MHDALRPPTVEDLYAIEGKAEIVHGELVLLPMTGDAPGYAGDEIYFHLRQHVHRTGRGRAVGDGKGFVVDLPHRRNFSPDAAYWMGRSGGMRFHDGAPLLAVEVRSEGDYGRAAEREMADKRRDYFAAGTLVVWDVDLEGGEEIVRVFREGNAETPAVTYRRGDMAEAEPAVSGWTMPVDDLFEPPAVEGANG